MGSQRAVFSCLALHKDHCPELVAYSTGIQTCTHNADATSGRGASAVGPKIFFVNNLLILLPKNGAFV